MQRECENIRNATWEKSGEDETAGRATPIGEDPCEYLPLCVCVLLVGIVWETPGGNLPPLMYPHSFI